MIQQLNDPVMMGDAPEAARVIWRDLAHRHMNAARAKDEPLRAALFAVMDHVAAAYPGLSEGMDKP